jgi:carboxylesterase
MMDMKGVARMVKSQVIVGAEDFFLAGNSIGIVLCHGFNGTPQSVKDVGEELANNGYTVYAPRLTGHGTTIFDMEKATYHDWIADIQQAYHLVKETCERVFIIGQSMGGALALHTATEVDCDGVLTINAALSVPEYESLQNKSEPRFMKEGKPDIKNTEAIEITYDQVPLNAISQLLDVMNIAKQQLQQVKCPAMIFVSPEDHVVPAHCSYDIFDCISSTQKELVPLQQSYHVATLDYDQDIIIQHIVEFIQRHSDTITAAS